MGYELESAVPGSPGGASWLDQRLGLRWQRADERLEQALRAYATVRRESQPGEARWIEAQLNLAEARQRWRECADEAERLAECIDLADTAG